MVNREKFDGIFLDLEMPTLNGFDLARLILKSSWNKSTPIVIVTGRDERKTMQDAFTIGATFFIQKPVDRQKLKALFRTVSGGMLENRRKYTRVPLQANVACTVGSRTVLGASWNLSMGGMQVEVGDLKPKDAVRLSFQLPASGAVIEADGIVVWANDHRQGIQFTTVSEQSQQYPSVHDRSRKPGSLVAKSERGCFRRSGWWRAHRLHSRGYPVDSASDQAPQSAKRE
jgi:DNA-binding response OmpR family regulator